MQRNRIVHTRLNTHFGQAGTPSIALFEPNREDVIHVAHVRPLLRNPREGPVELLLRYVAASFRRASVHDSRSAEFDAENGALDTVHPVVERPHRMLVAVRSPQLRSSRMRIGVVGPACH